MVGLQILKRTRQVSAQLVQAYKGLPVANISDCMTRMTAAGPRLRPMHRERISRRSRADGEDPPGRQPDDPQGAHCSRSRAT